MPQPRICPTRFWPSHRRVVLGTVTSQVLLMIWILPGLILPGQGGCLEAAQWNFTVDAGNGREDVLALPPLAFHDAQGLTVDWSHGPSTNGRPIWLDLRLVTSDHRCFTNAGAIGGGQSGSSRDSMTIPLDGSEWTSDSGVLGADAAATIVEIDVGSSGGGQGRVDGAISIENLPTGDPSFTVEFCNGGLIDRGPWRELWLRLIGDPRGELGNLDLVDADGHRRPLFLDQPADISHGQWRPRGPCRWVLRLGRDETPSAEARLSWRRGTTSWQGPALPSPLTVVASMPLEGAPLGTLPVPLAPIWKGRPLLSGDGAGFTLGPPAVLPACLAPTLIWRSDWTGFRGPQSVSYVEGLALDGYLAYGTSDIDLLPQWLFEEHGAFRFGLSPWTSGTSGTSGPWRFPEDALSASGPWQAWRRNIRAVIARARATPGLIRWRLGLTQAANDPESLLTLHRLAASATALIRSLDRRPVLILHPQLVAYGRVDPAPTHLWFDFARGPQGWVCGPTPLVPPGAVLIGHGTDHRWRRGALAFPLNGLVRGTGVLMGGVMRDIDSDVFNLDRVEFDARSNAGGPVQLYAWVTDRHHHWYQEDLGRLTGDPRWQTVGVDFSDGAAMTPVGNSIPWTGDQRRRIRRIGIIAYRHDAAAPRPQGGRIEVAIARMRRFGWPAEEKPVLAISPGAVSSAPVHLWQPIQADFHLSQAVTNPYDPDSADIHAEVIDPSGRHGIYPAYWSEPFDLTMRDGTEVPVPAGEGSWHLRLPATMTGAWRVRLSASVGWRGSRLLAEGPWSTVPVLPPLPGTMAPVRNCQQHPRWLETGDGRFFYPLGLTLRSPGDVRQDQVLGLERQHPSPTGSGIFESAGYERQGTRMYARWMTEMEQNHMNFARVWMCPWWCALEWRREWGEYGGLGVYNQAAAGQMDRLLDLARQHGIYLEVELQNHGMASEAVDQEWRDSPYNADNGGPCAKASDFFTNPEAKAFFAKRLRYTIARWGYCTQIGLWVLSSEIEFTGSWWDHARGDEINGFDQPTWNWVKDGLAWFRANDPFNRPVSVHFSHPWIASRVWAKNGLGFNYSNCYTGYQTGFGRLGGAGSGLDTALWLFLTDLFKPFTAKRPTVVAEWGGHWEHNTPEVLAAELRTGVWMQAVLPFAGNTGFWWWLWVDASGTWRDYRTVAAFMVGEDPRGLGYVSDRPTPQGPGAHGLRILGMRSPTQMRYYLLRTGLDRDLSMPMPPISGTAVIPTGQPGSHWQVERWSCRTGTRSGTSTLIADGQGRLTLVLDLAAHQGDAAFKLHRQ